MCAEKKGLDYLVSLQFFILVLFLLGSPKYGSYIFQVRRNLVCYLNGINYLPQGCRRKEDNYFTYPSVRYYGGGDVIQELESFLA